MRLDKLFSRLLALLLTALVIVTVFGNMNNKFCLMIWIISKYFGEIFLIGLLWYAFSEKIIRSWLFPIGLFYLWEIFTDYHFYMNTGLYDALNSKYLYLLPLGIGGVFMGIYIMFFSNGKMDKR